MATPIVDKDLPSQFWRLWYQADELERLKLVEGLTGMGEYSVASLTNSYLTDLAEYLEKAFKDLKGGDNNVS